MEGGPGLTIEERIEERRGRESRPGLCSLLMDSYGERREEGGLEGGGRLGSSTVGDIPFEFVRKVSSASAMAEASHI